MTQVAGAFVRLRPSLSPDDREQLEDLSRMARALADGIDKLLGRYAPELPELEERT